MKKLFTMLFALMFVSLSATSQKAQTKTTNPKAPIDFKKKLLIVNGDSVYSLIGSVMLENGHKEKIKVLFESTVSINKWDVLKKEKKYSDYDLFSLAAMILTSNAKYKLKNTESFSPLPKQFFMLSKDSDEFISNFKMMGRNGFGNLTETTSLVSYNPYEKIE